MERDGSIHTWFQAYSFADRARRLVCGFCYTVLYRKSTAPMRILRPGIASALGQLPTLNAALRRCSDKLEQEINAWVEKADRSA